MDSHFQLVRCTRRLLAWGTTLHIALEHLDTLPPDLVALELDRLAEAGFSGSEAFFLGAPETMNDLATGIARRVEAIRPAKSTPTLADIYIVALRQLAAADVMAMRDSYQRIHS